MVLAVVVGGVGIAWTASTPRGGDAVVDRHVGVDRDRALTRPQPSAPIGVSNALGAPIPEAPVQATPRDVEDWVARTLPVAGPIVPVGDDVGGTVRIERVGDASVAVRLQGLTVPPGHRSLRIVLSRQVDLDTAALAAAHTLTTVPAVAGDTSIVTDPTSLEADVRTVAVLDDGSGEVLGVALLVPVD